MTRVLETFSKSQMNPRFKNSRDASKKEIGKRLYGLFDSVRKTGEINYKNKTMISLNKIFKLMTLPFRNCYNDFRKNLDNVIIAYFYNR